MTTQRTYKIPAHNLDYLKAKIEKVNRRAAKLGADPISLTVGDRVEEFAPTVNGVQRALRLVKGMKIYYMVEVTGNAPTLGGWSFIGTIQHAGEAGNVVACVPGEEMPEEYRTGDPLCEHCNLNRRRNDTFVVRNEEGETKQVGRNCLCDFLGGLDPHNAAAIAALYAKAGREINDCEDWDLRDNAGAYRESYYINSVLALTASMIDEYGWLSRSKAYENGYGTATADRVFSVLTLPGVKVSKENQETAEKALAWVREEIAPKEDKNDYEHNLSVVCAYDAVDKRGLGLVCSAVSGYLRHVERKALDEKRIREGANSNYFGEIKKRDTYTLTLTGVTGLETDWGYTALHRFVDQNGNQANWFATGDTSYYDKNGMGYRMVIGNTYSIKGTVKAHKEYKGVKQTTLNRCKVLKEIA